jgi:hypothetical protein
MRNRKAGVVCVIAACIATGTALVLMSRVSHETASVASSPPVNAGAVSKELQLARAVAPETLAPKPAVKLEPASDPALRRRTFQPQPSFVTARGRYRSPQYCPADFNHDDVVDEADLATYVECWNTGDEASARRADVNRDQVVDGADMTEFLNAYFNNDCNPQSLKERRVAMRPDRARGVFLRERTGSPRTPDGPQGRVELP